MPRNPIDTWQEELWLLKDDETPLWAYYIMVVIYDLVEFLSRPVGLIVTVMFVLLILWLFWRVSVLPLSPMEKLRKRIGLVLLALTYPLVPIAVILWLRGSLITWIFVLPPAVLLSAALYLLLVPTRRKVPDPGKTAE